VPVLKNERHELMAQHLAEGMSARKAYIASGYRPDDGAASQLSRKPQVMQRVSEIMDAKVRATVDVTKFKVAGVVSKLWQVIEKAESSGDHKVAVEGLKLLLQAGGYLDSPSLYHDHLFQERLTPEQVEQSQGDKEAGAHALGAVSMLKALQTMEKIVNMKTIDN
jgi:hypothetical protein